MVMRLALFALALAGCFQPSYHNGDLVCATGGTPCPDGYHCASDKTCWQNGQDPTGSSADMAGEDLASPAVDGGHLGIFTTSCGGAVNASGAKHSISFSVGQKVSGVAAGSAHSVQLGVLRGTQAK